MGSGHWELEGQAKVENVLLLFEDGCGVFKGMYVCVS